MTRKLQFWLCLTILLNCMPLIIIMYRTTHPPEMIASSLLFVSEQMDSITYSSAVFSLFVVAGSFILLYRREKIGLWIILGSAVFILLINFVTPTIGFPSSAYTEPFTITFTLDRGVSALIDGLLLPSGILLLMIPHWNIFI